MQRKMSFSGPSVHQHEFQTFQHNYIHKKSPNKRTITKPLLVLMTRWPAANRCKSRLAKEIGGFRAAQIQKKLTQHTIEVAKAIKSTGLIEIKLAIDGIGKKKIAKWSKEQGIINACSQGKGNLGLKMKRQIFLAQGKRVKNFKNPRTTILIGTDVPNICPSDIFSALNCLNKNELVIGPSKDGGYWLIGFSNDILNYEISWTFSGIEWGENSVLEETLKRVRLKGIKYELIEEKKDIDNISDLIEWQK